MSVALIDYGAGNLTSVIKGLRTVEMPVQTVATPSELVGMTAIVIPGVGNFEATRALGEEWRHAVSERIAAGVPLLGICLGLQWLFEGSDEAPDVAGLGLLPGRCFRLPDVVKVPHVGWNTLDHVRLKPDATSVGGLLAEMPAGAMAYFTHSFAAPVVDATAAVTTHGAPFTSVAERGRVFGTQFHPEKSGVTGLRILRNFAAFVRSGS